MIISYRSVVGIDITGGELRFVELSRGVRGLIVSGCGVLGLSTEDKNRSASEREMLVLKIRELIDSGKIKSKKVVFGLSRDRYFFRRVSLPPVASDKLKPMVENQAERMFPIRGDHLVFDYQEIGRGGNGGRDVIMAGAHTTHIEEIMSIAKGTGLELLRIDMREMALCNLLVRREKQLGGTFILLNIDEWGASMELVSGGYPLACRTVSFKKEGMKSEKILIEIERVIGFHSEVTRGAGKVDTIFYSGSSAWLSKLVPDLERSFNIKSERVEAKDAGVEIPEGFEEEKLSHALGLALSGYQASIHKMDMQPGRVKKKRKKDELVRTGVLALAIIFLSFAFSVASVWRDEARLEDVQLGLASIEGRVTAARELKREYEDLARRVDTLNDLQADKPHWLVILKNLSEAIPEDAWLTLLEMKQGEPLRISGQASSAATLIPLLENSLYLKNVKFEAPTTTRDLGGEEVETFRITADVDWSGNDNDDIE